jgi:hypothetical protein
VIIKIKADLVPPLSLTAHIYNAIVHYSVSSKETLMQIFMEYILPNVALFGSIYLLAKYVENSVCYWIENYDESRAILNSVAQKIKL